MSLAVDFRKFAFKGNVIDLAVGVIIGGAFGKIVSALVADIVMPLIALTMPSGDWRASGYILRHAADPKENVVMKYGDFMGAVLDFFVIAMALFIVVTKVIAAAEARAAKGQPAPDPTTKECSFCLESIPAKATRCKACTSQLA